MASDAAEGIRQPRTERSLLRSRQGPLSTPLSSVQASHPPVGKMIDSLGIDPRRLRAAYLREAEHGAGKC